MKQRKTGRDWAGRFAGPRVNCENVPCLPVGALTWMLDDPPKGAVLDDLDGSGFRKDRRSCTRYSFHGHGRRNPVGEMR